MIRVVLVDDSADIIGNIERILHFEPDIEVVGTANDGESGVRLVRETKPDVVMLDINMPGMSGLTAAEAITSSLPGTQVIMMSVQSDTDYLRRAMLAGARDYILKPFDANDISGKIRQVHGIGRSQAIAAAAAEPERGRVATVFGPRGGCGCTTVAINLALALRGFTKRKVVIVDGVPQFGDVGVMLNLHDNRSIADLARKVDELDSAFAAEVTVAHSSGIRALLAPGRPEAAELIGAEAMRRVIQVLRQAFDFVIVDAGHALTDSLLAILDETDRFLLLTTPDIPSIKSTRLVLDVLEALEMPADRWALVISQAGRRFGVKSEDIERSLGCRASATIPYDEAGPLLAANQGRPMYTVDPEAPLCRAVLSLAMLTTGGTEHHGPEPVAGKPPARRRRALWARA